MTQLTLEMEKKKKGMALSASKHADILNTFRGIARYLGEKETISIEDVRTEANRLGFQYEPGNWIGSVFKEMKETVVDGKVVLLPMWECTGFIQSTHRGSHARMIRIWRLRS